MLIEFGSKSGCDSMTVEPLGNLYLAVRSLTRPGSPVLDPGSTEMAYIPTK